MKSKIRILFILMMFTINKLYSQCDCMNCNTHQSKPEILYAFKQGCVIGICPPIYLFKNHVNYSNSCILNCNNQSSLDEFNYAGRDSLNFRSDSLIILTYYDLPNGKGFKMKNNLIQTRFISCSNNQILVSDSFNYNITRYNSQEINRILKNYNHIKIIKSDKKFTMIAERLLMCYLSGSEISSNLFLEIKDKTTNWDDTKEFKYTSILKPKLQKFASYLNHLKNQN